jgi:hypothetical protein
VPEGNQDPVIAANGIQCRCLLGSVSTNSTARSKIHYLRSGRGGFYAVSKETTGSREGVSRIKLPG